MLIVFAISITPVIVFHDAFAKHTDTAIKNADCGKEQAGKKLFNCHCDHIVAEWPFTGTALFDNQPAKQIFAPLNADKHVQIASAIKISSGLRGPPVVL